MNLYSLIPHFKEALKTKKMNTMEFKKKSLINLKKKQLINI